MDGSCNEGNGVSEGAREFKPFDNNSQSFSIVTEGGDELVFENGCDFLAVYGDVDIPKSADGLSMLKDLADVMTRAAARLEIELAEKKKPSHKK